jgi:hypothetical protein
MTTIDVTWWRHSMASLDDASWGQLLWIFLGQCLYFSNKQTMPSKPTLLNSIAMLSLKTRFRTCIFFFWGGRDAAVLNLCETYICKYAHKVTGTFINLLCQPSAQCKKGFPIFKSCCRFYLYKVRTYDYFWAKLPNLSRHSMVSKCVIKFNVNDNKKLEAFWNSMSGIYNGGSCNLIGRYMYLSGHSCFFTTERHTWASHINDTH